MMLSALSLLAAGSATAGTNVTVARIMPDTNFPSGDVRHDHPN